MEWRELGTTSLKVSVIGFGCGSVGGLMVRGEPAAQNKAIGRALDAGVTYFDTAAQYGEGRSEENLGRALSDLGAWDHVVVGTKAGLRLSDRPDLAGALKRSLQESLRRLGRDSIDLLQLHSQVFVDGADAGRGLNLSDVLGGVAEGMKQVVADGLARHVGFTATGDAEASHAIIGAGLVDTVQAYFNILNPSAGFAGATGGAQDFDGIIEDCDRRRVGVFAIRVLAAGAVSGSPERAVNASGAGGALVRGGEFDKDLERAVALPAVARELGLENSQELAFRFAIGKKGVSSALIGFSNIDQVADALRWTERGPLLGDAIQRVLATVR